jgi:Cu-Zn family superoxide dismutase
MRRFKLFFCITVLVVNSASAESVEIGINKVNSSGIGEEIGSIKVVDTKYGALFTPNLKGLTAGAHGFHIHQNPECGSKEKNGKTVPGLAAGGHYDPSKAGFHSGPYSDGHLGDLAFLYVNAEGGADTPVLAPRIKVADLKDRSLIIHAGGDNYSDSPKKLGGGGPRIACGLIN